MSSTLSKTKMTLEATLDLSSAIALNLVYSKNLLYGKGLNYIREHFNRNGDIFIIKIFDITVVPIKSSISGEYILFSS